MAWPFGTCCRGLKSIVSVALTVHSAFESIQDQVLWGLIVETGETPNGKGVTGALKLNYFFSTGKNPKSEPATSIFIFHLLARTGLCTQCIIFIWRGQRVLEKQKYVTPKTYLLLVVSSIFDACPVPDYSCSNLRMKQLSSPILSERRS